MSVAVAVEGAGGYAGAELLRLLAHHAGVRVTAATSRSGGGRKAAEVHPHLDGITDLELIAPDDLDLSAVDISLLALPHGASMPRAAAALEADTRVIDLSADFRLRDAALYEDWYGEPHSQPTLLQEAVFGLAEFFADQIAMASLVANPGCYPTSILLGILPLLAAGIMPAGTVIVDSKSGVTGAGILPRPGSHFPTVNESFRPYSIEGHRHLPEIEQILHMFSGSRVPVQFVPHLLPINRGLLSTIYFEPTTAVDEGAVSAAFEAAYGASPAVRVRERPPSLAAVRGSNYCDIYYHVDSRTGMVLIVSAIDNLVKGAAGQAIQNLNLMTGQPELRGLQQAPVVP